MQQFAGKITITLILFACSIVMCGCSKGSDLQINGQDRDSFKKSLDTMEASLTDQERMQFQLATIVIFNEARILNPDDTNAGMRKLLDGKTYKEIMKLSMKVGKKNYDALDDNHKKILENLNHQITLPTTDAAGDVETNTVAATVNAAPATRSLPDTGQTTSCTANFSDRSDNTINPPHHTKLDASGGTLADSATSWTMARDDVTGLIWEVKIDDGSIHDRDNIYTWQNAQGVFIAQLNSDNFGGHSDWRLPTIKELSALVDTDAFNPSINTIYLPNTISNIYWSSTTHASDMDAWAVNFYNGDVDIGGKSSSFSVRAVRGGQ
jgi:hypothetical protein